MTPALRWVPAAMLLAGVAATALGLLLWPERTWPNLLLDNFYLLSIGLAGPLFLSMQYLAGAGWSAGLRRIPEAMMSVLPVAALLVLALFFGRHWLYPWSHPGMLEQDPVLAAKAPYLRTPFVFVRMLVVLSLWVFLAWRMRQTSLRQDSDASPEHHQRLVRYSAIFAMVFAYTFSLASFDWLMSLDPRWFSTIFAVYVFAGLFVLGLAVITLTAILLRERGDLDGVVSESQLHDLGKLLFAFSTFWAYVWVSQYLLIWYGNIPEEISHYLSRTGERWITLFLLNLAVNWVVPFVVLLPRSTKRNPRVLKWVCVVMLAGRWLDLYLMIMPELAAGPAFGLLELLIATGYAGLCLCLALRSLAGALLVPANDPYLADSLPHQGPPGSRGSEVSCPVEG